MNTVLLPDAASEGEHRWGRIDITSASPEAGSNLRLTVYPPGMTSVERRLLRIQRDWPVVAGAVVLLAAFAVSAWSFHAALALVALYIVGIVVTSRLSARIRAGCRHLEICTAGEADAPIGDVRRFAEIRTELETLEEQFEHGGLTSGGFEVACGRVYGSIEARKD